MTLEDFLVTLEMEIQISKMSSDQLERTAQLTQRTNQFNTTTIRRTDGEIQYLVQTKELDFYVVEVKDRFGDYGLVGVIAFETRADMLFIDTFLLSCRVLARRVEHHMCEELGKIALAKGLKTVALPLLPSQKNEPALDFLNETGADYRQPYQRNGWLFVFPAQVIASMAQKSLQVSPSDQENQK